MTLIEVNNKEAIKAFLDTPKVIYRNDPHWSCPLDMEVENTFNPNKNSCFKNGEACRWVLKDDKGMLAGRIAAFYDRKKATTNNQPTGGIGFFECINNQEAANMLFTRAKEWLADKGMEAMDGPVNFGENFVNWGLLTEGFTYQGYGMPYNLPYYRNLFENFGFKTYFEQYTFHDHFSRPYPEQMRKFGERFWRKPEYSFRHFEMKNSEKYLHELVLMYNKIWSDFHQNYTPLEYDDLYAIFQDAKAIIDEELIWFGYHKDQPIGFLIAFPDVNQVFRKLKNGKLSVINILKLLYYRKKVSRARLLLSGVIPEFQRTGVVGGIYIKLTDTMRSKGMEELELSWVGDYNITVNHLYGQFGAIKAKTHITFRYMFDPAVPFERFNNLSSKYERDHKKD